MEKESNHYYAGFEWCYKNIEPKIICEKYIGSNVEEYKLHCFVGEPQIFRLCIDRSNELKLNFYDMKWNLLPFKWGYNKSQLKFPKPCKFSELVELSRKLSAEFNEVRVDFCLQENKIYFGELTFYSGAGMKVIAPREWDYKIGDMLDLKK